MWTVLVQEPNLPEIYFFAGFEIISAQFWRNVQKVFLIWFFSDYCHKYVIHIQRLQKRKSVIRMLMIFNLSYTRITLFKNIFKTKFSKFHNPYSLVLPKSIYFTHIILLLPKNLIFKPWTLLWIDINTFGEMSVHLSPCSFLHNVRWWVICSHKKIQKFEYIIAYYEGNNSLSVSYCSFDSTFTWVVIGHTKLKFWIPFSPTGTVYLSRFTRLRLAYLVS